MAFIWCLYWGRISEPFLIILCVTLGAFLAYFSHGHTHHFSLDALAQKSRLNGINSALKFWTLFALMIISVASTSSAAGVFLMIASLVLAVFVGGLKLSNYIRIITLPIAFLLMGGLALLFEVTSEPIGVLNFNAFGFWLCVSENAQSQTALTMSRAFGAVSCLMLLTVSTPMPEIINVLRRARCPELIIDLMYLIYRYIFILLSLHHEMHDAAKSRLGFRDYRTSLRSTGRIYSNLLGRSYQFACKNFDAMESRCYSTGIRFLERKNKIIYMQAAVSAVMLLLTACLGLLS